ncbi:hypothetical protein J6590_011696 [Homalodisca vitripennis]|nr:hypothetical protein J6590_011696 [Homalodisca vitripennis]
MCLQHIVWCFRTSFTYNKKSIGPRIDHWGTPKGRIQRGGARGAPPPLGVGERCVRMSRPSPPAPTIGLHHTAYYGHSVDSVRTFVNIVKYPFACV